MKISVVLPSYQEAENLKNILPLIREEVSKIKESYEIIVVDTIQEMDCTREVCLKNDVVYVSREGKNTYGDAIRTGIKVASGEYMVIMDADGSHNPSAIPKMYSAMMSGNDLVIASRYCEGAHSSVGFILKLMSWILNSTYRVAFNLKIKDLSNSFRMYKTIQIKKLDLDCDNFDILEEILIKLFMKFPDIAVYEVPIHFVSRQHGQSKRHLLKFIISYLRTLCRLLKMKAA